MRMAAVPIQPLFHPRAHRRQGPGLGGHEHNGPVPPLDRRCHPDAPAVPIQRAAIARLAATLGIKQRAIQHDPALFGHIRHPARRGLAVGIV